MRDKANRKSKKKNIKKRKNKTYGKKNGYGKSIGLRKVLNFKFQTLGKFYNNFTENRKKDKVRQEKLKSQNREKQIKVEQKNIDKLENIYKSQIISFTGKTFELSKEFISIKKYKKGSAFIGKKEGVTNG